MSIAIAAGWTASSILYPFDILRQSLGTNTEKESSITTTARKLFRTHGVSYFYKGFVNSMVGTAAFRASFNGIYDSAKSLATCLEEKALIAYGCAMLAGAICYPLDIVRRRRILINSNKNFMNFGSNIWKHEGISGFYKGSKLIPLQSLAGALILLIFDTAGFGQTESKTA